MVYEPPELTFRKDKKVKRQTHYRLICSVDFLSDCHKFNDYNNRSLKKRILSSGIRMLKNKNDGNKSDFFF